MIQRGRKSAAGLAIVGTGQQRLEPPELPDAALRVWLDVTNSTPPDRWTVADRPLLTTFCLLAGAIEDCRARLMDGTDPAALADLERLSASLARIAVKLRLTPSSRVRPEARKLGVSFRAEKPLHEDY